jgi:hypothetical protein
MNARDYDTAFVDRPAKLTKGDTVLWPADRSATSVLAATEDGQGRVLVVTVAGVATLPAEPGAGDQRLVQVLPLPPGTRRQ